MRKKFKKIVASTLALTMMFTSSALIDALNAKADESTAVETQFSEALGLNLNPDTNKRILSELTELNNGKTPEIKMNDNGFIKYIDGNLSDKEVHSENDALNVLADISPILGINDVNKELVFDDCTKNKYITVYVFKQQYNGLDILNSKISLIVDNNTKKAEYINNEFASEISLDINPDITSDYATQIIQEKYLANVVVVPELAIFAIDENEYRIVWHIFTDILFPSEVYIDAKNGDVIYEAKPVYQVFDGDSNEYTVTENAFTDNSFNIDITEIIDNGEKKYRFYDPERKITVLESVNEELNNEWGNRRYYLDTYYSDLYYYDIEKGEVLIKSYNVMEALSYELIKSEDEMNECDIDLITLYNTQQAYRFFQDLTEINKELYVIPQIKCSSNLYLGFYLPSFNKDKIVFTGNNGANYDGVVHEFTHFLSYKYFKGKRDLLSSKAIEEAYSQILSEYADGTNEWWTSGNRNLSSKLDFDELNYTNDKYEASMRVTHVSYLMHKYGIPDDLAVNIWFTSLSYLSNSDYYGYTYNDCRKAVIKAAEKVLENNSNKEEYINIIKKSFNEVRIFGDDYLYADSNADGIVNVDDLYYLHNHLIGAVEFEKEIQNSNSDLNYDGVVNNTDLSLMLKVESIDKSGIIGDVNADGEINIDDLNTLQMFVMGQDVLKTPLQDYNADLCCDGKIDVYDVILLRKKMITILTQPQNVTAKIGSTASTSVEAIGEDLSYQWYEKNLGEASFSKSSINIASYNADMTAEMNGREIYCQITDKYGNSVQSETVTLYMGNPVKIIEHPETIVAASGTEAKATIKAEGDGLTYKWYYKNKSDSKFYYTKTFDNMKTYSVKMSDARDGRQVYCVVTDKYGKSEQSEVITLYMGNPLTIINQPKNTSAEYGNEAKVRVSAKGDGLTYKWYYKNKGDSKFYYTKTFDNKTTYSAEMNEARDGRQVYCEITDKYGVTIQTEIVTIGLPVAITEDLVNTAVELGEKVELTVSATGHGLTYEWHYKNKNMKEFDVTKSFKTNTYTLNEMTEARAGREVYCVITDIFGNSVQTETVTIGLPVEIIEQPVNTSAEYGCEAKVRVVAEGDGLTYKWYYKNMDDSKFHYTKTFDNMKTYSVEMNEARDGRQIYCEITDKYGVTIQTEIVTIGLPVEITEDLVDVTAELGEKVEFSVSATGHGLTYEWHYKNKNMKKFDVTENFKTNKYGFDKMTEARVGREVYCVITDIFGNSVQTETVRIDLPDAAAEDTFAE